MKQNRFKNTMLAILTALMLAMSAGVVTGEGSDPLDPSDGGADWDGDGLTNKEEQDALTLTPASLIWLMRGIGHIGPSADIRGALLGRLRFPPR